MLDRRSCRSYTKEQLKEDDLQQILLAGTYAASGMNMQSAKIVVVQDADTREQLRHMNAAVMGTDTDPFYGAPVVLVVLANKEVPTYLYDGSLVIGNLMTAANALGIGSCWIHRAKQMFESEEGKQILADLGIEGQWEGIGNCVIGYADEEKTAKPRKENWVYKI